MFMDVFLQQFQDLKIQLEEIKSATNNFNDKTNCIGAGGFGKVYKGKVSHSNGRTIAAIKRLDPKHGQGIPEFLKEVTTLSRYTHENLISLLGFCYESNEMILVYDYASRGSLDRYLDSTHLTWSQRITICLDAAKGLRYLHDPKGTHQRLIHCDVKSSNILLDDNWNAKLSDFGLSTLGPANEQYSVIVSIAAGTLGYCDPQYAMTHTLTKESDVYSFGVVLFEVLCGRLCYTYKNHGVPLILVPSWIESYKQNKLHDIIFKNPNIQPLDQTCLETISDIAYRCLKESREDRPNIVEVVTQLETALETQVFSEWILQLDCKEIMTNKTAQTSLNYSSKGELSKLLSKGVLLNRGKTWFSLNKKGEHCEMISFADCLDLAPSELESNSCSSEYHSRFSVGPYFYKNGSVKTHVKTQFLSPGITYTVNLVFKFRYPKKASECHYLISLRYKLQGETKTSISYLASEKEDGWWMCELYQFTSHHKIVDLEILFHGFYHSYTSIIAEGIEFLPLEEVEHKDEKLDVQPTSVENWEEKLSTDYKDILKRSKDRVQWTTKKEMYSIIRKGFLINDGQEKCYMISARVTGMEDRRYPCWVSVPESRFGEAVQLALRRLSIFSRIQSQLVSTQTKYASYLVYKLPKDHSKFKAPVKVKDLGWGHICYVYLVSPETPIIRPKGDESSYKPVNRLKIKGLPQQREDGWMQVQIWEFQTSSDTKDIVINLQLTGSGDNIPRGLIIQGIEFRPM